MHTFSKIHLLSLVPTHMHSSDNWIQSPALENKKVSSYQPTPPPLCSATQVAPLNASPTKFCTAMSVRREKELPGLWHAAFVFVVVVLLTSFHCHLDYGWLKAVLEAGLTHSFSHIYSKYLMLGGGQTGMSSPILSFLPTLQEPNADFTPWFTRSFMYLWSSSRSWRKYRSSAGR